MAKKKSAPEPVTATEPDRPEDEQLLFETAPAAPPPARTRSGTRRGERGDRKYGARSARERRATSGRSSARRSTSGSLSQDVVTEMLENPTIEVSEAELRRDYGYVVADLRSMAILSVALVVALFALAAILPK